MNIGKPQRKIKSEPEPVKEPVSKPAPIPKRKEKEKVPA